MKIKLSERMKTIADMVIPGSSAADIGTDHGYIPAYLLSEDICPDVILTDIAEGPLDKARLHFERYGLEGDFRLGRGLEVINDGEVSTVIIAGMGGETIIDILNNDIVKTHSFERIILQPRTFVKELRTWLTVNGFRFVDYRLCRERKLLCEVFAVENGNSDELDEGFVSTFLLKKGDPLLEEYLARELKSRKDILTELSKSKKDNGKLIARLKEESQYLEKLIK